MESSILIQDKNLQLPCSKHRPRARYPHMRFPRVRHRSLATSTSIVLVAVVIGGGSASAADLSSRAVTAGDCFNLSVAQLDAKAWPASARALDCAEAHTAEIAGVLTLPPSVAKFGLDSREVFIWTGQQCAIAVNTYAGAQSPAVSPETTRTKLFTFAPTPKEWKAGKRDIICVAGSVKQMYDGKSRWPVTVVKGSTRGVLGDPLMYETRDASWVTTNRLAGRALLAKSLAQPYPGEKQAASLARKACSRILRTLEGVTYNIPNAKQWTEGSVWTFCWFSVRQPR